MRTSTLQWGRDRLIAEIRSQGQYGQGHAALQWGRDRLIAEIRSQGQYGQGHAALQWGRDRLIAEMTVLRGTRRELYASMGPRSTDRGNDMDPSCRGLGGVGFNGAAID